MKRSILAARTQTAIDQIAAETARLGGTLVVPSVRGDTEHRQVALLEAIAGSLASIAGSPSAQAPKGNPKPAAAKPSAGSPADGSPQRE